MCALHSALSLNPRLITAFVSWWALTFILSPGQFERVVEGEEEAEPADATDVVVAVGESHTPLYAETGA